MRRHAFICHCTLLRLQRHIALLDRFIETLVRDQEFGLHLVGRTTIGAEPRTTSRAGWRSWPKSIGDESSPGIASAGDDAVEGI